MKHKEKIAIVVCALLHAAVTFTFALTHVMTFKSSLIDDGTTYQVLFNLLHHGVPLSTTNPPFTAYHWLGFHFSPILFVLLPGFALWPTLAFLQLVQSLCLAGSGIILFYTIIALRGRFKEALAASILYWINPFIISAAIWDFHEISLAVPAISLALLGLCKQQFRFMLLGLILLLLTKEHYGISVAGFGLLWTLRTGEFKRGSLVIVFGLIACALIIGVIMPCLSGAPHPMLQNSPSYLNRYSWLHKPQPFMTFLQLLFNNGEGFIAGMLYLLLILASALMLPILAPWYLLPASSDLLANLLSTNSMPRHIAMYHSAAIIPVAIIAGFIGYQKLCSYKKFRGMATIGVIAIYTGIFQSLFFYPFSFWELHHIQLSMDKTPVRTITQHLPEGEISAQVNIGSFFAGHTVIYPFPHVTEKTQAIILHLENPFAHRTQQHFGLPFNEPADSFVEDVRKYTDDPNWYVDYWQNSWLLLLRGKSPSPNLATHKSIEATLKSLAVASEPQSP